MKVWGGESAFTLLSSHLFVVLMKKVYSRSRPYLSITNARVVHDPLTEYSFRSGHTTAIFSIIIPFSIHIPIRSLFLYPLACCVGISRVFLGIHYPSNVVAGAFVGTFLGDWPFIFFSKVKEEKYENCVLY
ncbi:phosphatase PAP2 family protein [Mesobacillus maritimus]|uniref:phosphatase PAP2 family protein n=1 Tax=Mesobacillus maritimus TaxID=1643336 RepID=UPI003850D119